MWKIEMGGYYNSINTFGRKIYINPNECNSIRNKFNNTDVYATVMQYEDIKNQNDTNMYGSFYLDLDMAINNSEDYDLLVKDLKLIVTHLQINYDINPYSIKYYFTGKKGFHLLINAKIFNITPCKKLNLYYKELAKEINDVTINKIVDTKIYDTKRLIRLPNSINSKSGRYKVPISYNNILEFSYEDILLYASSPKPLINIDNDLIKTSKKAEDRFNNIVKSFKMKKTQRFSLPKNVDITKIQFPICIKNIFQQGADSGNRNNTTIILSSALLQRGISYKDTLHIVSKWNDEKNSPSLNESEIKATVTSAYNQLLNGRRYGCSSIKELDLCDKRCNKK